MTDNNLFTSESVSEGHPDKVADQVSDAVLDAMLAQDKESRVACETLIKTGLIVVAGEVRSNAQVDIDKLVRDVVADIGYNGPDVGFDPESCTVVNALASSPLTLQWASTKPQIMNKARATRLDVWLRHRRNRRYARTPHVLAPIGAKASRDARSSLKFLRPDARASSPSVMMPTANPPLLMLLYCLLSTARH